MTDTAATKHSAFCELLCALVVFYSASMTSAQPVELPPSVQQLGREFINQAVNGAVLFSSQSAVAAGVISIDDSDASKRHIDLYKAHHEETFGEARDEFAPFVIGNVGFFHLTDRVALTEATQGNDDFLRISSFSLTGGGGVRWRPVDGLEISPSFSIAYSHIQNDYDYNSERTQALQPYLDGQIFNWDVNSWTYIPSLKLGYTATIQSLTLKASTQYSHLINDSFDADSPLAQVHSSTAILHSILSASHPLGVSVQEAPLSSKFFIARGDIYGKARDAFPFHTYHEIGADIIADVSFRKWWVSELSLGGSYLFGNNIEGWRIGGGIRF